MTIATQDIKLYRAAVNNDQDFGGGRMSGNVVVDGELNNLFSDINRVDRTLGRSSLRKAFPAVTSDNSTTWAGVHVILLRPAADEGVSVTMFGRDSHVDTRLDAQRHLEQYLASGPPTGYYAWDTQPEGAMAITLFTGPGIAPPQGGETLVLSVERGSVNNGQQQYIRCVRVNAEVISVVIGNSSREVQIITIETDQALRFDVPGEAITDSTIAQPRTVVRRTTVAEGKRYYSIHALSALAESGSSTLQLEGILTPVVPANQSETAITDQQVGSDNVALVPIGAAGAAGIVTETVRGTIADGAFVYLAQRAAIPGEVELDVRWGAGAATRVHMEDDGRGNLVRLPSSGASVPAGVTGSIDYGTGQIIVSNVGTTSGALVAADSALTYRPAARVADVQHTDALLITPSDRRLVYTRTLSPRPTPRSLRASVRILGRWITLSDRGDGTLAGAPGEGSGQIQYATGTTSITLPAEPDVGSHILWGWGSGVHFRGPVGALAARTQELVLTGAEGPWAPGSVAVSWEVGEDEYVIVDDGDGNLSGDGTGTVDYAAGEARLRLDSLPPPGTALNLAYETPGNRYTETPTPGGSGGTVEITLANGNSDPHSIRIRAEYSDASGSSAPREVQLVDDGDGNIIVRTSVHFQTGVPRFVSRGTVLGTVDYVAGVISLAETSATAVAHSTWTGTSWTSDAGALLFESLTDVRYSSSGTPQAESEAAVLNELRLDIEGEDLQAGIQPGSFLYRLNTWQYFDVAGLLYRRNSQGIDQQVGAIDYEAGAIAITSWAAGSTGGELLGLLSTYGRWGLSHVTWRVGADQLAAGSFQITAQRFGAGLPDQATSNQGGVVTGPNISGTVNFATGVYDLTFDEPVIPELSRFNATAVQFLPVNPEVIGLDPVRLPANGRLPTVRAGDLVVIHNTQETTLPNPLVAGETYATREAVTVVELFDQVGARVPSDRYTFVKATGDVTMANPLDLDGFVQPIIARHRIEDMAQCIDAQINGFIGLNAALTHDFPAGESYLSSALFLSQEVFASQSNLFTQATWTNVWSNQPIGNSTVGQYNNTVNPILVTNRGAIRERWRLNFTSTTAFQVIGETVGLVGTGDVNTDTSPVNPATGAPYMTIFGAGFSGGWNQGNQLRFNTEGAHPPVWFNRCTLPGNDLEAPQDHYIVEMRGDAN